MWRWAQVDAGADYVVSQLVFDVTVFQRFVADCRSIGIRCQIVPGVMPITGAACLLAARCDLASSRPSLARSGPARPIARQPARFCCRAETP